MPEKTDRIFFKARLFIRALFFIFILASAAWPGSAYPQSSASSPGQRELTLKDSIDTARANNRSIQIQIEEIEAAKAGIMNARSLFLPQVTTGLAYTYTGSVLTRDDARNDKKDSRIFTGYQSQNEFSLGATESIYNGGANIANLEQAKLNLKAQKETLRATNLEVEFETKRLYYGILLAYETKRIAKDLVDQAAAHYEEVKLKFEQGTASKFELLQSKTQVSRLIPQLVNADNAIELLMAEFKKLLVIKMKENISIKGTLEPKEVEVKEDDLLKEAYAKNPEMILKLLGIEINKWAIEFAKSGWLPQVNATAGYTAISNDLGNMINQRHDNWNIGISATIALFDGFATKAKVDEAKARYNQSRLSEEDIIDRIAVDIKTACLNLSEAKAIIDSQKDSIVEARESLRLSEVRYVNGVGINLDIFDAQVALAQVEQSLEQGIYDYVMAKAEIDRTIGREFYNEESIWQ